MSEMNPLRRRMIEDMKVRNSVAGDARGREIRTTLQPLANVAVRAPRFFYGVNLARTAMVDPIPARKRRQLPVILIWINRIIGYRRARADGARFRPSTGSLHRIRVRGRPGLIRTENAWGGRHGCDPA
jgi:hypothetical protein